MKNVRNGCVLVGLAAVIMIFTFSCSLGTEDVSSDTGISLYINPEVASRLLTVVEYEVTTLDIDIRYGEEVIHTFNWDPSYGPQRIYIPILNTGQFDIDVTHNGINADDEEISITENAKFRMDFGIITVIKIVPGLVGVIDIDPGEDPGGPCDELIANWTGEQLVPDFNGGGPQYPVIMDFNVLDSENVEMISRFSDPLHPNNGEIDENWSMKGTWACQGDYITGEWMQIWSNLEGGWVSIPWTESIPWTGTYLVDGDTMSLGVDFDGGEPPAEPPMFIWDFVRASDSCYCECMYGQWGGYANFGSETEPYILYEYLVLDPDGTIISEAYPTEDMIGPPGEGGGSMKGVVTSCVDGVVNGYHDYVYNGGMWQELDPVYHFVFYLEIINSGNTMFMTVDLDGDGVPEMDWVLERLGP